MWSPYPRGRGCLDQGSHRLRVIFFVNDCEYPIEINFSSRKMIFYNFIENPDLDAIKIQNGIVMIASHHLQNELNEAF